MKNNIIRMISRPLSIVLATTLIIAWNPGNVHADNNNSDPVIMVSLGDSYSSGEGIEPFYGQDKSLYNKVKDENWLAHRSQKSWPSLLKIPGIQGTMSDYNVDTSTSSTCQWYFKASSGAETKHFNNTTQSKKYNKRFGSTMFFTQFLSGESNLPKQLDIFNNINGSVDYVTLSVGGNDVDFSNIITTCVTGSTYLGSKKLEKKMDSLWNNFDTTQANIKKVYVDIQNAAGRQAEIIVAGYPKLLDSEGKGFFISKEEATMVNSNVSKFNDKLENIVSECQDSGMNIHFVDVEAEFDKDGGHQAYSNEPWINKIMLGAKRQDLDDRAIASAYSVYPNELGAQAYARCVNAKIEEIENSKKKGTLSGKICKASDRVSPISDATISVYKDNSLYTTVTADETGNYVLTLPVGDYRIEISASGYIDFISYATVTENYNTYMETFLMVAGSASETGTATGIINNALTGDGVEGVSLSIRNGWNNREYGEIVSSAMTDSSGKYSVTLPLGNYTMIAEKSGYVTGTINIIVQSGTTYSQNGTITPIISGDNFRIVLTWVENPRDLDSHVEGTLSDGNKFHVYYGSKSQYDGEVEICNLDVDDTTSYGPETITLNATTDNPYYYYIYRYAGSGTVATSEAKIKVYQGANLVASFNVPTDQGGEDYWNVFAIVNGELLIKNTITSAADVSYANASTHSAISSATLCLETETFDFVPK